MKQIENLEYLVFPGNIAGQDHLIEKYNAVYKFWKGIWSETLEKLNLPPLDIAQFLRHNFVCALMDGDRVVACHLYTKYDVRVAATSDCEYFQQFSTELLRHCRKHQINTILTQEYLSVAPDFRKTVSNISMPEVIIGLGSHIMFQTKCDATGGTVRSGAPSVERVCREINCELLDVPLMRYNLPHKFFIGQSSKVQLPGSEETKALIKKLWNERTDYTNQQPQKPIKIAA